jgi:microsomal epoxide hydrolase
MSGRGETAVRPFVLDVPQAELDDLGDRLVATRWPDALAGAGWSQGVPLGCLKELVAYWRTAYDWREPEAQLNGFPQFTTTIEHANVHFLHIRSAEASALPLLMTTRYRTDRRRSRDDLPGRGASTP